MAIAGYWRLNGNSNDASGNGYNGTDANVTYSTSKGILNGSASFNGSSSTILIASNLGISNSPVTLSCWVRIIVEIPVNNTYYYFIGTRDSTSKVSNRIRYYYLNSARIVHFIRTRLGVVDDYLPITLTLSQVKFQHLMYTWDGTSIKGYIDGKYVGISNKSGLGTGTFTDSTSLGVHEDGINGFLNGELDECKLDNTVWTGAMVKNEYSRVKGFF